MAMAVAAVAQPPAGGAPRGPIDLGTVRGGARQAIAIAVPPFLPGPGSAVAQPATGLSATIARDLAVTGLFRVVGGDQGSLDRLHRGWLAKKNDFGPWRGLGARFFVTATYAVDGGGGLSADVYLFDATSGSQVFGKRYAGYAVATSDRLAHQVADDILRYLTAEEGIAGTQIAFISTRSGSKEVFVMDASGERPRQVTNERTLVTAPCWGARGGEIYYTSYARYNPDLMGISLADNRRWAISEFPGNNISPDWSEKSQRIALILGRDGNQELYLMDRGGRSLQRLTATRAIESSPSWSPDGRRLAFVSNRGGGPQIYTMNADGSNAQRVSFGSGYCTSPAWSPDGRTIAYTARVGRRHELCLLDVATNRVTQLTNGPGNSEDPTWSPDSRYLAFANDRSGRFQIFRVRVDGTGLTPLTTEGENTSPAWGPAVTP